MEKQMQEVRLMLVDMSHQRTDIEHVKKTLEDFIAIVRKIKQRDRETFVDQNLKSLAAIKFELDYVAKLPEMKKHHFLLLSRDLLFGSLLRKVHVINETTKVTRMFNEFIKGITAFSDEDIYNANQPSYHRKKSCPPRGSKNTTCIAGNTNTIKKDKSESIRKCYIERMIYDNIWSTIMHCAQDKAHIEWLTNTEEAYKTCYSESSLQIDIEYSDNNIPLVLKIYENDNLEIYEKRYDESTNTYIGFVDCLRYENEITKRKINEYDKEGLWM